MGSEDKLVVFDFGNVLIDLNYDRHFKAYRDLFGKVWPEQDYHESVLPAMHRYEKGEISDDAFIWVFQQINPAINPRFIVNAWITLLGDIHSSRIQMLERLSRTYELALLSNINSLHLRHIHRYLDTTFGIKDFEERFFSHVFYSHHIGMRKPEEDIYKNLESITCRPAEEILFIDDREDNILKARSIGWQGIQHDPGVEISEQIEFYLQ